MVGWWRHHKVQTLKKNCKTIFNFEDSYNAERKKYILVAEKYIFRRNVIRFL